MSGGTPEQSADYVCPDCSGSGLIALCGKVDDPWSGPCVMRSGHDSPCWGEEDVAGDWTPAAPCRTCAPLDGLAAPDA